MHKQLLLQQFVRAKDLTLVNVLSMSILPADNWNRSDEAWLLLVGTHLKRYDIKQQRGAMGKVIWCYGGGGGVVNNLE